MKLTVKTSSLSVAGALLAAPIAVAATPSPSPSASKSASAPSPSASASPSATPSAPKDAAVDRPIKLKADDKGNVPSSVMPDATNLFSLHELQSVFPQLTSMRPDGDTQHLTITGLRSDVDSTLTVTIAKVGKSGDVRKAWDDELTANKARATKVGDIYAFTGANKLGVADSFNDGTTAHVLLDNAGAATIVRISGVGFLSQKDSYSASRKTFRNESLPALVSLLGKKVDAGK